MVAVEFKLCGKNRRELDTEIKYSVAAAHADGVELVRMDMEDPTAPDASRIRVCMLRVLRTMKKEGSVQFFITPAELDSGSTEAEFLKNKYQATIDAWCGGGEYYVRI